MMEPHRYQIRRHQPWSPRCGAKDPATGDMCLMMEDHPVHILAYRPVGAVGVETCPFGHCRKTVNIVGTEPAPTIEQHQIPFNVEGIPQGTACPASLMVWPLTLDAKAALTQQALDWANQNRRDFERVAAEDKGPYIPRTGGAGESQFIKHPGRMGREPPLDSPDWQRGGREDEDVPHAGDVKKGPVPPGVGGGPVGRGSDMSGGISVNVGIARAAMARTNDCAQTLHDAQSHLNGAIKDVTILLGDGDSPTLKDWLATLKGLHEAISKGLRTTDKANGHGETFITNITT